MPADTCRYIYIYRCIQIHLYLYIYIERYIYIYLSISVPISLHIHIDTHSYWFALSKAARRAEKKLRSPGPDRLLRMLLEFMSEYDQAPKTASASAASVTWGGGGGGRAPFLWVLGIESPTV